MTNAKLWEASDVLFFVRIFYGMQVSATWN